MGVLAVVVLAQESARGDAKRLGFGEAAGIRLVGDDGDDLGREIRLGRCLCERQHVGAATRDEDDDPLLARRDFRRHRARLPL